MKHIISLTDARKRLFEIVGEVASPAIVYTLTERGSPKAVIMSATEYESWVETMEVMRDSPNILKHVKEARAALKSGAWRKWPVFEGMKEGHLIFNDKPKSHVYTRTQAKRTKRTR